MEVAVPRGYRSFRACMNCTIVKLFEDFFINGCPNCEVFMKFRFNPDRIVHCSTFHFVGIITLPEGYNGWWTRIIPINNLVFGMYACDIFGSIPHRFLCELLCEDKYAASGGPSL